MHTLYNSGGIIFLYIPAVFISNISIYILNTKLCVLIRALLLKTVAQI